MNNPFDYTPDEACARAFRELVEEVEALKTSGDADDAAFCRELEAGKMLGVLIAEDSGGVRHTLRAFSGQLGEGGFYRRGFVDPTFDYLQPDGYFKVHEAGISRQNSEIALFESRELAQARADCERARAEAEATVEEFREECRRAKAGRDALRESGKVDDAERAAMISRSQFEKAELRRRKKRAEAAVAPFEARLAETQGRLDAMKEKRRAASESLQQWLFSNFRLLNARGESRSLSEIFAATPMRIPPSGAGECCAPKLLQEAYRQGWKPVSIAEYWYGRPKGGEVRIHGEHYPACRGKCRPVLGWMLQGLDTQPPLGEECGRAAVREPRIVFENEWFCVVDKPSGMLSVPGRGSALSVQEWLIARLGADRRIKMAHRLDQDTSGLLIATFGQEAYKTMQSLFATRKVRKTYIAELDGDYESLGLARRGRISLPLAPDWLDRPRQCVDLAGGKEAVTDYEFTSTARGRSRVTFHPLTGRTHQLRVHAASAQGLGMPIAGDRLYGRNSAHGGERLRLHAQRVEFTFPLDDRPYAFESPAPF